MDVCSVTPQHALVVARATQRHSSVFARLVSTARTVNRLYHVLVYLIVLANAALVLTAFWTATACVVMDHHPNLHSTAHVAHQVY